MNTNYVHNGQKLMWVPEYIPHKVGDRLRIWIEEKNEFGDNVAEYRWFTVTDIVDFVHQSNNRMDFVRHNMGRFERKVFVIEGAVQAVEPLGEKP